MTHFITCAIRFSVFQNPTICQLFNKLRHLHTYLLFTFFSEKEPDTFFREHPKHDTTEASSKCPNSVYGTNGGSNKMINPIYIAVPVAGVCVLLALIIFAMYLLRRRNDYYERYQYPKTVTVPQHHQTCNETKCANACKLNRCTDSERSSSGSETKLFL